MRNLDDELEMDAYFNSRKNDIYSNQYTRANGYSKVNDLPEIINVQGLGDPSGSLKITTTPPGAEFFLINGNGNEIDMGTTPLTITDMDVGSYNYIIRLQDYSDYVGVTDIKEGLICCLDIDLEKPEKKEGCSPIAGVPLPSPGMPPGAAPAGIPGYIVIKESEFWGGLGILFGLGLAAILYLIFKKKEF